jgi:serine/threonine protein kinase
MAPEAMDHFREGEIPNAYSFGVDVWAIGVITVELMLKQLPFRSIRELFGYVEGVRPLELSDIAAINLSEACLNFVSSLLTAEAVSRPTAGTALAHRWLTGSRNSMAYHDSYVPSFLLFCEIVFELSNYRLFVESHQTRLTSQQQVVMSPASLPSLAWSSAIGTLLSTYQGPRFNTSTLIPSFRVLSLDTVLLE